MGRENRAIKEEKRKKERNVRVRGVMRELRPSLRDVSVAPDARLREQCAHMGFTDRTSRSLKNDWMPDDIMTDGNVSVCSS